MSDDGAAGPGASPASPTVTPGRPPMPTRAEAFAWWLRLGFVSFGGPAGQIALMHDELVVRRRWISERRFLHALNYCMVLPGPEAQQLATYLGWLMHRTWGGVVAGALFVLPSLAILVALSWLYMAHGDVPAVAAVLRGVKPAVTALVVHAAHRLGARVLNGAGPWAIAVAALVAIAAFDVSFPAIVVAAALAGGVGARLAPRHFARAAGAGHGAAGAATHAAALIDDDTPPPPHARFSRRRALATLAACAALGLAAYGALAALGGRDGVLAQMGWFFTKAALVTFGGAYAVLPYVHQGAVERHGWLNAAQMIDGLALGETTPGPLIMVVAFVGYVGGWTKAVLGEDAPALSGAAAAAVATFFTFLPSFAFILVGAPFIESSRGRPALAAPLAGISAAVVGVVANLALFFAWHVLWPRGWDGPFDAVALAIGVAAGVALLRFRAGVVPVVLACGAAGLAWELLRGALRGAG